MLQDLGKLVEKTKNAVKNNFNYEDVGLSEGFKGGSSIWRCIPVT